MAPLQRLPGPPGRPVPYRQANILTVRPIPFCPIPFPAAISHALLLYPPCCPVSASLAPLDAHRGLLRWHIHYNLLVLRMVSYAADLHWATVAKRTGQQQQLHDPQQQHQQQDALGEHGQPRSQDQGSKAGGAAGGRVAVAVGAGGAAARGTGEAEGGGRAREGRRGLAGLAWLEREERVRSLGG